MKPRGVGGWRPREHAVEHKGLDVHIEVESSPEALEDGDGSAVAVADPLASGGGPGQPKTARMNTASKAS